MNTSRILQGTDRAMSAAEVSALRHAMGLSLDGLARMLDVNPRTVRSWESGRDGLSEPSEAAVRELATRHEGLVQSMVGPPWGPMSERVVQIPRVVSARAIPPRGWYLTAAGRAMMIDPSVQVEWV